VVRRIDLVRFFYRAMIEPQYDVAVVAVLVVEVWPGDGDWLVCIVREDCERASSVEPNAANGVTVNVVLVHCSPDRRADTSPDVRGRLFLEPSVDTLQLSQLR
jgi:hypothetical protein